MNSKRSRKKEGFLQVKLSSRSALGKAWKRKWVVVQQNTSSTGKSLLLELYMEKGAYHKTVTSLLLEDVVSVRRTKSKTQEHAIEISSASKILLAVSADSETETQEWLSMFQMNLLPSTKELACPPGIPNDFVRVSVVPNKDSERLKLGGDYYAHISLASINLYDTHSGDIALEWDLRHLRKFMLISRCHPLDVEKIVHILPSKRSPKGEGEFMFFSSQGKQLVEGIYERLSNAMTVKSRRSRSTSMLFEITQQELEQMFESEQPPEETLQEADEEVDDTIGKSDEGEANDETAEATSGEGIKTNGVDGKDEVETEKTDIQEVDEAKLLTDGPHQEVDQMALTEETSDQGAGANTEITIEDGDAVSNVDKLAPPAARLVDVADQLGSVNIAPQSQCDIEHSEKMKMDGESDQIEQEDDKGNQTNPEEMDECVGPNVMISSSPTVEEHVTSNNEVVAPSQDDYQAKEVSVVTRVEPVSSESVQENSLEFISGESNGNVVSPTVTTDEADASIEDDQCRDETPSHAPLGEPEVRDEETSRLGRQVETEQSLLSSTPEQSAESTEDTGAASKSGSQEVTEAEEVTFVGQTQVTLDFKEDQLEQSIDPVENSQVAVCENIQKEQTEAGTEEYTSGQNVAEGSAEKITEDSLGEMNQDVHHESDAVVDSSEMSAEFHDEISHEDLPKPDIESTDRSPDDVVKIPVKPEEHPPVESSENSVAVSDLNQNNSNSNDKVRRNTKTVPLPNTLTSRMAEAMRNVQKRRLSTDVPVNQQTQTGFPPDSNGSDQTSEIIV